VTVSPLTVPPGMPPGITYVTSERPRTVALKAPPATVVES
jgi:hypothetical protein